MWEVISNLFLLVSLPPLGLGRQRNGFVDILAEDTDSEEYDEFDAAAAGGDCAKLLLEFCVVLVAGFVLASLFGRHLGNNIEI